jgi:uncharacterized lipoprotein YddW (UPF0748 family)
MKRTIFIIFFTLLTFSLSYSQPKNEVRAAWVTTAYGLDWPRTRSTSTEKMQRQQSDLLKILDKLKAANFNTVLFQVRSRGDVYYRSQIEPMSIYLTDKLNGDPGYDPLTFAVDECHKRGMECIAWMVSIPLGSRRHVASLGKYSALRHTHGGIVTGYKSEYYLNPANPETKVYLMDIVREIATNYDVDGFVFDYLRYPEYAAASFDKAEYNKYAEGRPWLNGVATILPRLFVISIMASRLSSHG